MKPHPKYFFFYFGSLGIITACMFLLLYVPGVRAVWIGIWAVSIFASMYFLNKCLKIFSMRESLRSWVCVFYLIVIAVVTGATYKNLCNSQLADDGIFVTGIISLRAMTSTYRKWPNKTEWWGQVYYKFMAYGELHEERSTKYETSFYDKGQVGDSVIILYSKKNPFNNRLIEFKNKN